MSVVVVHPQVQHSFQLARALHEAGLLKRFYTSIFLESAALDRLPALVRNRLWRRASEYIPANKVWTFPYCEILWRLAGALLSGRWRSASLYYSLRLYDRVAARRLKFDSPRIVIGFENSSLALFREAKRLGASCVLDAASTHFNFQGLKRGSQMDARQQRVDSRKAEEIALADKIVVLSTFAKQTYIEAGVPPEKLAIIAPGSDLTEYSQNEPPKSEREFHYLFVGSLTREKGVDLLVSAFKNINVPGKTLTLVGANLGGLPELNDLPNIKLAGYLFPDALRDAYVRADVVVLPSRLDGFGLVVAEAMATGTPVILSSAVGAKDLVKHGENGWIFESENAAALAKLMEISYQERNRLAQMGACARDTVAGEYTWEAYRVRIGLFYEELLKTRVVR